MIWSDGHILPTGPTLIELLVLGLTPAPIINSPLGPERIEVLLWSIERLDFAADEKMLLMFEALLEHDDCFAGVGAMYARPAVVHHPAPLV